MDGTLADTNYLHTVAWARALQDAGEWAPMNAIHRLIGMGGDQLVPTLLGYDNKTAAQARSSRYKELMGEARVFPGAHDLLERLHHEGVAVVLATSAPDDELGPLLELLDADAAIDAITTADDVASSKPDPEVFLRAMTIGSIDPERALAVGDSVWDIQAARAAGIGCIAVESGGFSQHELAEAGAARVYRDVQEVLAQLRTSPIENLLT